MRLDEWQKFLDSQFLDSEEEKPPKEATPTALEVLRDAEFPAPLPKEFSPPSDTLPEPDNALQSWTPAAAPSFEPATPALPSASLSAAVPPVEIPPVFAPPVVNEPVRKPMGEPVPILPQTPAASDDVEMPSLEDYIQRLKSPSAASAPVVISVPDAVSVPPQDEPPTLSPSLPAETIPVPGTASEAVSAPPTADIVPPFVSRTEAALSAEATTEPTAAEQKPARRYNLTHRRSRNIRNRIPEEEVVEMTPEDLWNLVPRHVQSLIALGSADEEIAQNSYRRQFKESRIELVQRLLDPTLSLEETAWLLNVCPTTVRRYTNRGLLMHQRTEGDQRRFKLSDILAYLEAQSQTSKV